jgi:WD40 repeat protein
MLSFSQAPLQESTVAISSFGASLFGCNAKSEISEVDYLSPTGTCLQIPTRSRIDIKDLWDIETGSEDSRFTAMVSISKSLVAVGLVGGEIAIVPITELMTKKRDNWLSTDTQLLRGHSIPISALFFLESGQWTKMDLLFSGDKSGKIILWDLNSNVQLISFYNHSRSIMQFLSIPHEVGGKFRSSVVCISVDNSVSLINPEELAW